MNEAKDEKLDIVKHESVPEHVLLSEEEREDVIKKYGDPRFFPKISVKDPAVRQLGVEPGDLIKVSRLGARVPHYRVVVGEI